MKSKSSNVDMLVYFLISIFVLTVTGLLYKTLFVVYNYPQFSSLSSNEVAYAIIWGIRFDLASAAFFSLISCAALWFFSRFKPSQDQAALLLAVMLVMQVSLQLSDTMYFAESGRHVSYEMRDALADASGLFMTALTQHTLFIVLAYLLCSVIVFSVMRYLQPLLPKPIAILKRLKFNLDVGIKFFVIVLLSVIAVRGGVTGLPQSVISVFRGR